MVLSNTAVPIEYGKFRDQVIKGEIPVNAEVSMQMNRIDYLIESPDYYYDDEAIEGFIRFCEEELTLADGEILPYYLLSDYGPKIYCRGITLLMKKHGIRQRNDTR